MHGLSTDTTAMKIPTLKGVIKRRLLVNFRADPEIIRRIIPQPFRPKLHRDHSIVGVCLIRLEHIRPAGLPGLIGISSENAAHRIAVEWTDGRGQEREGVYVPRRDAGTQTDKLPSSSCFSSLSEASDFFESGGVGYSITHDSARLDGLKLNTLAWSVSALELESVYSSFYANHRYFPEGSVFYDHTLIMRDIEHEWHKEEDLYTRQA
jgi:Uncharacterized conserved protein (COG2071)